MIKRNNIVKISLLVSSVAIILLLANMGQVILPFILAGFLAYFLQPLADFFLKHKVPLIFTIILVYVIFILILYLFLFMALPMLFEELAKIAEDIPQVWEDFSDYVNNLSLPEFFMEQIGKMFEVAPQSMKIPDIASVFNNILQIVFALLLAPLLSFYILNDKEAMKAKIITLLPVGERSEILRISADINRIFRSFFSGYVLLAIIVAILAFILYSILGIKYSLLLALFLGICDLIPYFGPFIGAIPAVIIAIL